MFFGFPINDNLEHFFGLFNISIVTGATSEAGVAYPSGATELTLIFVGFVLLHLFSVVLCVLCLLSFILLAMVLSVFRITISV